MISNEKLVELLPVIRQHLAYTWQDQELELADDLAELLQHEYDHLDGILAVQRAIDNRSLKLELPDRY